MAAEQLPSRNASRPPKASIMIHPPQLVILRSALFVDLQHRVASHVSEVRDDVYLVYL